MGILVFCGHCQALWWQSWYFPSCHELQAVSYFSFLFEYHVWCLRLQNLDPECDINVIYDMFIETYGCHIGGHLGFLNALCIKLYFYLAHLLIPWLPKPTLRVWNHCPLWATILKICLCIFWQPYWKSSQISHRSMHQTLF